MGKHKKEHKSEHKRASKTCPKMSTPPVKPSPAVKPPPPVEPSVAVKPTLTKFDSDLSDTSDSTDSNVASPSPASKMGPTHGATALANFNKIEKVVPKPEPDLEPFPKLVPNETKKSQQTPPKRTVMDTPDTEPTPRTVSLLILHEIQRTNNLLKDLVEPMREQREKKKSKRSSKTLKNDPAPRHVMKDRSGKK